MRKQILFASHNAHKVEEVRQLLPEEYSLLGLSDIDWTTEIPEPYDTYADNAKAKARFIFDRTGISCFADDSGLEIDALEGRPGVLSARYAGPSNNSGENMKKVLEEMGASGNRNARFHSVIAYVRDHQHIEVFYGTVEGTINDAPAGKRGFGYDPIFIPRGFDRTFGQLPDSIKNKISHRALAMQKFVEYLRI